MLQFTVIIHLRVKLVYKLNYLSFL